MWFERDIKPLIQKAATQYPVVTITGPRQSGKTSLVTKLFPEKTYVNLEAPDIRAFAESDPRGFLATLPQGAILDEVQRVPELLSYIQTIVDQHQQNGEFILTGSHQFQLHHAITQSLAGRTAMITLLPLTIHELAAQRVDLALDDYLWRGFYPKVYQPTLEPTHAYRDYIQTYIERDVRLLINIKDLSVFQNFLRLCASRIGQIMHIENLANELGVSGTTVKNWFSILEASYILFRLPPYFENFGKRFIKSPKIYFTDVGLASYLLGIENINQLSRDPLRGSLIENLAIIELVKTRQNLGRDPQLYFCRDNHQNEIDVLFKQGSELIPIEIKAAKTFHPDFLKGLRYYSKLFGERFQKGYLLYGGDHQQMIESFSVLNIKNAAKIVDQK